jgi:hypothetical protein
MFAPMLKFEPFYKIGGIEIPIVNQESSLYMRNLTQKLKERLEAKKFG